MKPLAHVGLGILFLMQLSAMSHAQAWLITTYAGRGMPQLGAQAITQPIDWPSSVAPDGSGGFYVASRAQNRIYRVTARIPAPHAEFYSHLSSTG